MQTTLRELQEQGAKEIARKVGDSEGGIFIGAVFEPKVRAVGHVEGHFDLAAMQSPVQHAKAGPYAAALAERVPEAGGWDEFIELGSKAALPLQKMHLRQTQAQAAYWCQRVEELAPSSKLPQQVRAKLATIATDDVERAQRMSKRLVDTLKMKVAELQDPDGWS